MAAASCRYPVTVPSVAHERFGAPVPPVRHRRTRRAQSPTVADRLFPGGRVERRREGGEVRLGPDLFHDARALRLEGRAGHVQEGRPVPGCCSSSGSGFCQPFSGYQAFSRVWVVIRVCSSGQERRGIGGANGR